MSTFFVLVLLTAVIFAILYGARKQWNKLGYASVAALVAFIAVGVTARKDAYVYGWNGGTENALRFLFPAAQDRLWGHDEGVANRTSS